MPRPTPPYRNSGLYEMPGLSATWIAAAPGPVSEPLYEAVCAALEEAGTPVERGVFGADMKVASVNDGPFTVLLESP